MANRIVAPVHTHASDRLRNPHVDHHRPDEPQTLLEPEAGHLWFQLEGELNAGATDQEELTEVAEGIRYQLEPGGNPANADGWVRTRTGISAALHNAKTIDHGLEWLEAFADSFGGSLEGVIQGGPEDRRPNYGDLPPEPAAYIAYSTGDLRTVPSDDRDRQWFEDPAVTAFITERAVGWTYFRGCEQYLTHAGSCVQPVGIDHGL